MSYRPELLHGSTSWYPLARPDLEFDLRPYLDLDLGGQKFKIAITYSFLKLLTWNLAWKKFKTAINYSFLKLGAYYFA